MKVAVIQPSYLPWLGYFYMMKYADLFVYFDDVQYDKNGWRNRNKILVNNSEKWITLPIKKSTVNSDFKSKILNCVGLNGDPSAIGSEHKRILGIHYKKSKFLHLLDEAYSKDIFSTSLLADIIIKQTEYFLNILHIKTETVRSSNIIYKTKEEAEKISPIDRKNLNLLSLLKEVGATEYISGVAAQSYLNTELFERNNIQITWNPYAPKFENGYLSIIHYLLTLGPDNVLELINH
jgi:hypothetical protein